MLRIKERQTEEAITACLGLELTATAQPAGVAEPTGPFAAFAAPPSMAAPIPGQTFEVRARLANRGRMAVAPAEIALETQTGWTAAPTGDTGIAASVGSHAVLAAALHRDRRGRRADQHAALLQPGRPAGEPLHARRRPAPSAWPPRRRRWSRWLATSSRGRRSTVREVVRRREAKLPYGDVLREVRSVPRLGVTVSPITAVVPLASDDQARRPAGGRGAQRRGGDDRDAGADGAGGLAGRTPAQHSRSRSRAPANGPASASPCSPATIDAKPYRVEAVARPPTAAPIARATSSSTSATSSCATCIAPSTVDVRGIDVTVLPNLKVGYVMGVGDQVPLGLQQLGAQVTLLGERDLASADLSQFDAIMTGTRAYAVREDLKTYNQRLLDYVKAGGNMIVLYNTAGARAGPLRAVHRPRTRATPRRCRRRIRRWRSWRRRTRPSRWPNAITKADFDGWVEQRGSKFFSDLGQGLHADDRHLRQGPGAAARRLAHGHARQGHVDLFRLRAAPAVALRRARRVSDHGQSAGARQAPASAMICLGDCRGDN